MIDRMLEERELRKNPIRVAVVGAGVMSRMVALQLLTPPPGIRLVCVADRTIERASRVFEENGVTDVVRVGDTASLEKAVAAGRAVVTADPILACDADGIDAIVEVTGTLEWGARTVVRAIERRKHVVLVNAELDSTLGPVLHARARKKGVVITNIDGDEPGVAMNLIRYARTLGLRPVAAGNLKGMIDPYRTPETQKAFAAQYGQNPAIVTSFADGTKLSMELAILANASGFGVGRRGMYGPKCAHVKEMATKLPANQMLGQGLVDYALGAEPFTGAFVVIHEPHEVKRRHLSYLKMGDGPFYVLYTPYHLPHIQIVSTIARVVLTGDATTEPLGAPVCEVLAVAKRDLQAGEMLDGVGGFMTYGVIENSPAARAEGALPIGLVEGCRLRRAVPKDAILTFEYVELPAARLIDELWREQVQQYSH